MIFRSLAIFCSLLLLLHTIALDFVIIFAPTKVEVKKHFNENKQNQELTFACQFHDCGCTKETCKISCCCKTNHEVFDEIKKTPEAKCHEESNNNVSASKEIKHKSVNVIQKMICTQDKLKENDKLLLKRDLFLLVKQKPAIVILKSQTIQSVEPSTYQGINTQTFYIPDNPPPNIS